MTPPTGEHPAPRARGHAWRWGTPVVLVLCGALFATSAANSDGSDLRPDRYTDLASLVRGDKAKADRVNERLARLDDEVEALSAGIGDRSVNRIRTEVRTMSDPAGFQPQEGTAVEVVMDDSPPEIARAGAGDPNDYVVHQQDLQAVVNAMWRGGATAVTLMGQRLVSTTGIKCEGNAVTLHGLPYSPPYKIVAIGDVGDITTAISADRSVEAFRRAAADPEVNLGWEVSSLPHATAPAYKGLVRLDYAKPLDS